MFPLRPARRWGAALCACALGALACDGQRWIVATEDAVQLEAGAEDSGAAERGDGGANPTGSSMCPPDPSERQSTPGCWPSRHVGSWRGFFLGAPQYVARDGSVTEFPLGEVVLRIEASGAGSIAFGSGSPPAAPLTASDPFLCRGSSRGSGCPAASRLVEGFAYALQGLQLYDPGPTTEPSVIGEAPLLFGERLRFEVSSGEPWRPWCALQSPLPEASSCVTPPSDECATRLETPPDTPACAGDTAEQECGWYAARDADPCHCVAQTCAAREALLAFELQMAEDGLAMRGSHRSARVDLVSAALELARESSK